MGVYVGLFEIVQKNGDAVLVAALFGLLTVFFILGYLALLIARKIIKYFMMRGLLKSKGARNFFINLIWLVIFLFFCFGLTRFISLTSSYFLDKEIVDRLKINSNEEVNRDIIKRFVNRAEPEKQLDFGQPFYSWSTRYGRIYASQCSGAPYDSIDCVRCFDGGTDFYDANGKYLVTCGGGWDEDHPGICADFFSRLKASDADYSSEPDCK